MIQPDFAVRSLIVCLVVCLGLAALPRPLDAGNQVLVTPPIEATSWQSFEEVDHALWNGLLRRYVDDQGQVNYKSWKARSRDIQILDAYLHGLAKASSKKAASREATLAFWINAYNAVTVRGILREYPTTSIRNHTAKLFGYNIWDDLILPVGDDRVSLNEIEHERLRPMGDPRIHFAIVCASKSCPRLLNEAYLASKVDEQLRQNAEHFFAQPKHLKLEGDQLKLSSILQWFGDDFGSDQTAQLKAILPWITDASVRERMAGKGLRVSYLNYDWSLNE